MDEEISTQPDPGSLIANRPRRTITPKKFYGEDSDDEIKRRTPTKLYVHEL